MWWRVAQVAGLVTAMLCVAAYWAASFTPAVGGRSVARPNVITQTGELAEFTLVIAGRDLKYCGYHQVCEGAERWGELTDTIIVLRVSQEGTDLISIPRDTRVGPNYTALDKINAAFGAAGNTALREAGLSIKDSGGKDVFEQAGALGLKRAVENLIGINVDYYAVINIEFAERVIDALGGVDVYLPEQMDYDDYAAGLHVHLAAGNHHLSGKKAVDYLRIRKGYGDDYGRMDRAKAVLSKLFDKLRSSAILGAIPTLIAGLSNDVVTNMDLPFVQAMLPHASQLRPRFSTLPILQGEGSFLEPNRIEIRGLFSQENRLEQVSAELVIEDASAVRGLGEAMANLLSERGFHTKVLLLAADDAPTRVVRHRYSGDSATADALARLLNVPVFVPYPYPKEPLTIHLGRDAASRYHALALEAAARP